MRTGVPRTGIARSALALALCLGGCKNAVEIPSVPVQSIPGHSQIPEDTTPKENPRVLPAETYIRSYLMLFGGLSPVQAQKAARGQDGGALFDSWNDYLSSLGLPDYRYDVPRGSQTNTLMVTTFERLGIALCDRAVEHDLQAAPPMAQRTVFAFDPPPGPVDAKSFAAPFDVLHRTFLGYPARLAPPERAARFHQLYSATAAAHGAVKSSRFKPSEAAWATVCYGLLRHPEFQLY